MKILGIESSCDETAASVVEDGHHILSHIVRTQIAIHAKYGGVVPEIAARSHIEVINAVIEEALREAELKWSDIDGIAVTNAPGLSGSLLIGTLSARTLALQKKIPLYPIHHVEAHVYANFLISQKAPLSLALPKSQPKFPLLALIVSGGHTQLVLFKNHGDYTLLGQTQDDAVGEAFDKVAKILGLPYPGGPSIAKAALTGNPHAFKLPKAKMAGKYDFSFSGLKTAVLRAVQTHSGVDASFPSFKLAEKLSDADRADFAASFQAIAVSTLVDKTLAAYNEFSPASVVIAGGVAANTALREELSSRIPLTIEYAPIELCTDNAVMIASLGYYYALQAPAVDPHHLGIFPSVSMTTTAWANKK